MWAPPLSTRPQLLIWCCGCSAISVKKHNIQHYCCSAVPGLTNTTSCIFPCCTLAESKHLGWSLDTDFGGHIDINCANLPHICTVKEESINNMCSRKLTELEKWKLQNKHEVCCNRWQKKTKKTASTYCFNELQP